MIFTWKAVTGFVSGGVVWFACIVAAFVVGRHTATAPAPPPAPKPAYEQVGMSMLALYVVLTEQGLPVTAMQFDRVVRDPDGSVRVYWTVSYYRHPASMWRVTVDRHGKPTSIGMPRDGGAA